MDLLLNSSASTRLKERDDSKSTDARLKAGTCFVSIVFDVKKDGTNDFHCHNCCVFGIDQHEFETIKVGLLTKKMMSLVKIILTFIYFSALFG